MNTYLDTYLKNYTKEVSELNLDTINRSTQILDASNQSSNAMQVAVLLALMKDIQHKYLDSINEIHDRYLKSLSAIVSSTENISLKEAEKYVSEILKINLI